MTTLEWALALAAAGCAVFPCKWDKTPTMPGGFHNASTDPDVVRAMWAEWPGPLIGIATGAVSNVGVLDADLYKLGGAAWFAQHGARLPQTFTVRTRRDGVHFYFEHRPGLRCSANKIADGIDVRADGGYVIFWPGAGCRVLCAGPMAPWPEWLDDMLDNRPVADQAHVARLPKGQKAADSSELTAIVRKLPNDRMFDSRSDWIAFAHALAAAFSEDPGHAQQLWLEHAAKRPQTEGEAERVWKTLRKPHFGGADYIVTKARAAGIDVKAFEHAKAVAIFAAVPLL